MSWIMSLRTHYSGQKIARSKKPGKKQHGQYKTPSIQPGSVDGDSCQALDVVLELDAEEESDYDLELPDSAAGPLR